MRRNAALFIVIMIVLLWSGSARAQDPPPLEDYAVVSVREYGDMLAGPMATSAHLSPDGTRLAHISGNEICVYSTETFISRCLAAEDRDGQAMRVDAEDARWSPDSRYLAFTTNDFLRTFRDSDLWVYDTTRNILSNLTDDGMRNVPILEGEDAEWPPVDLVPRWSPASDRILFLRYTGRDGAPIGLQTISPDGGASEQAGSINTVETLPIYALDWSPDGTQIAFNYWAREMEARSGVWISNLDGSRPVQVARTEPNLVPSMVQFSPDGAYLLTFSGFYLGNFEVRYDPEFSPVRVIEIATGASRLVNDQAFVVGAGWAPSGHALAYLVNTNLMDQGESGLYIASEPGEPGKLVYQGLFSPPTSTWVKPLVWASNDKIALSRSPERGVIVAQLGVE